MTYQEFLNNLQNKKTKKKHIGHCLGSRNSWEWVRHNKWKALDNKPCSSSLYSKIINEVNKNLIEVLLDGRVVELPYKLGHLYLKCIRPKATFKDNVLKDNYLIDWKKTLEYWYNDSNAKEKHKKIKRVQNKLYFLKYDKRKAHYVNKTFYSFRINRSFAKKIGEATELGILDIAETD